MISSGVKIIIKNLQNKIIVNRIRIIQSALGVLLSEGVNPVRNTKSFGKKNKISNGVKKSGEITISFVNDQKIKELNSRYLGKNDPTDVLAFDITDIALAPLRIRRSILADIVISTDTAIRNAQIFKTTPVYELYLYVIHGMLHLLGYDDRTKKDKLAMQKKQELLLKNIKIL